MLPWLVAFTCFVLAVVLAVALVTERGSRLDTIAPAPDTQHVLAVRIAELEADLVEVADERDAAQRGERELRVRLWRFEQLKRTLTRALEQHENSETGLIAMSTDTTGVRT
jgi:hypothetical protein